MYGKLEPWSESESDLCMGQAGGGAGAFGVWCMGHDG